MLISAIGSASGAAAVSAIAVTTAVANVLPAAPVKSAVAELAAEVDNTPAKAKSVQVDDGDDDAPIVAAGAAAATSSSRVLSGVDAVEVRRLKRFDDACGLKLRPLTSRRLAASLPTTLSTSSLRGSRLSRRAAGPAGVAEARLDMGEPALELGVGAAQRRLGIDVEVAREIGDREQQVADLARDLVLGAGVESRPRPRRSPRAAWRARRAASFQSKPTLPAFSCSLSARVSAGMASGTPASAPVAASAASRRRGALRRARASPPP